jgi:GT2 family glycosyltransferase
MLRTSIVIPTKNNINTIDRCLFSLMPYYRQGYINEIVVVDGHSTDGTLEVIEGYPVKLVFDEGKGNIGTAYDIGWRNAQGELIILLDSDVYLKENFFPKVCELLSDDKVGWISCAARAVVTNSLTKAQDEDWIWHINMLSPSLSWFLRLYTRIASGGNQDARCGGPCMIVRRTCLETVNGFQGLSSAALGVGTGGCVGDISVSQRIANRGWRTIWWGDAPIYHHPRTTFKGLAKQFYGYGKAEAYMQMEREFASNYRWHQKVTGIIARLGSPAVGLMLAIRFRNPLHLIAYPLPRYTWVMGYIAGWAVAKKSKGE